MYVAEAGITRGPSPVICNKINANDLVQNAAVQQCSLALGRAPTLFNWLGATPLSFAVLPSRIFEP